MLDRKAEIIGWTGELLMIGNGKIAMNEFLESHISGGSVHNGRPVPPFLFLAETVFGPDLAFVVRFISADPSEECINCSVFVNIRTKMYQFNPENAHRAVQLAEINNHGIDIDVSQYCKPHMHFISLTVSYPAEFTRHFQFEPQKMEHCEGITEIALTIDDSNIHALFPTQYITALNRLKQIAAEIEDLESSKKAKH
ncbi:hypothetical protein BG011_005663 [Mortierella polycephala]|uniref:Uncharacterized protein n=1 Tax=Mortierella polycephala TaxID=41804 RepID=A0A9P6U0Z4_9FUNG|nr:hypothetical protein BG011_005663 [Mortierella polycephala]